MPHAFYLIFLFALGACIGSFLNVVVWRLPRGESLLSPPSHCPKCGTELRWYDNIPVLAWIFLRGHCRYCRRPISPRYPIVEAVTGALFVFYYLAFFVYGLWQIHLPAAHGGVGRLADATLAGQWPMYALHMFMICALLAVSLIDAELFVIPLEIPWLMALVAIMVHALADHDGMPASLSALASAPAALAAGGGIGLLISIILWLAGLMPTSFPHGEPLLEVDRAALLEGIEQLKARGKNAADFPEAPPSYTSAQVRAEMRKEMLFLMPPMVLGTVAVLLTMPTGLLGHAWQTLLAHTWLRGLLGALLGALVAGWVVWLTRILGTMGFGRVAMGLGDVHLMFGVGAVIGSAASTIAFFMAPIFGLAIALYMFIFSKRREIPYGPYLSLATAAVLILYRPIAAHLTPGLEAAAELLRIGMPRG